MAHLTIKQLLPSNLTNSQMKSSECDFDKRLNGKSF